MGCRTQSNGMPSMARTRLFLLGSFGDFVMENVQKTIGRWRDGKNQRQRGFDDSDAITFSPPVMKSLCIIPSVSSAWTNQSPTLLVLEHSVYRPRSSSLTFCQPARLKTMQRRLCFGSESPRIDFGEEYTGESFFDD